MRSSSALAACALAGCMIPTPSDGPGELVVAQLDQLRDVSVAHGAIRWNDHDTVHEAFLDQAPVVSADAATVGTTVAHLVVHDDVVYLVDEGGVRAIANGTSTRIAEVADVTMVAVGQDNTVAWTTGVVVEWRAPGGPKLAAGVPGDGNIVHLAVADKTIYVATSESLYGNGTFDELYAIDMPTSMVHHVATAQDFAGAIPASEEVYLQSHGLVVSGTDVYWQLHAEPIIATSDYDFVVAMAPDTPHVVVTAQPHTSELVWSGTSFYWTVQSERDVALWRAVPGGDAQSLGARLDTVEAIADGYVYGIAAIGDGTSAPVERDLRRIAVP